MKPALFHPALLLGTLLVICSGLLTAAYAAPKAVDAVVSGDRIQQVGFRAAIQKLAIRYNLAGSTINNPDGTVAVRLQGDDARISLTLDAIRAGNGKSSSGNTIRQTPATADPRLKTFTIVGWTSLSRNITTPYDLVFTLRPDDQEISRHDAKKVWNDIALSTLKGEDLAKFQHHLEDKDD